MYKIFSTLYDLRYVIISAVVIYIVYAIVKLAIHNRHVKSRYKNITCLPRHWLWGNLVNCGERLNPSLGRHPDYGFEEIWNQLGQPNAFLVDLAPVDRAMLIDCDGHIAEQIVQPSSQFKYSVPKSDTLSSLHRLIGKESLITDEGEHWRVLRRRFNKGFAPSHLHSLSPLIISKTRIFAERLRLAAQNEDVLPFKEFAQDLTTDIITQITIEKDFRAQSTPRGEGAKSVFGLLTASRILSTLCLKIGQGFDPLGTLDPVRPTKAWFYEQIFDRTLSSLISEKLAADKGSGKQSVTSTKAITQLALSDVDATPAVIRNTVHQIKSFLFAGQDTTATLIQWMAYELSKAPHDPHYQTILTKLIDEHNTVFGPGPLSALDVLSEVGAAEQTLNSKLPFTTAFVKETLRLHPPAATARLIPEVSRLNPTPLIINVNGKPEEINGLRIYPSQWLIHRNPKVWGPDAHLFNPARWLDEAYMAKLPVGAYRPFERGPRNCIGQELAMVEGKIVLAAIARGFEFEKVGYTGRNGEKEVWNINTVTSVPVDGMVMRYRLRKGVW